MRDDDVDSILKRAALLSPPMRQAIAAADDARDRLSLLALFGEASGDCAELYAVQIFNPKTVPDADAVVRVDTGGETRDILLCSECREC